MAEVCEDGDWVAGVGGWIGVVEEDVFEFDVAVDELECVVLGFEGGGRVGEDLAGVG